MTSTIYVLSIGPVQDFIAAARRTRDLWFGSYLLSEISRAAARAIADGGGSLIFPALAKGSPELGATPQGKELEAFNVGNIILAEIPEGIDPADVHAAAEDAARTTWRSYADGARKEAKEVIRQDNIGEQIWESQINDLIEFNAAWVPLEDGAYPASRRRVMHLLGGRKSLRNFNPAIGDYRIPKCSLDGAHETVLKKTDSISKTLKLRLRMSEGEQLCAIDLTKRLAGGRKMSFPSVTRVALDPWVRRIMEKGGEAEDCLDEIGRLCAGDNLYSSGSGGYYPDFPYDGQVCYPDRLDVMLNDLKDLSDGGGDLQNLKEIKKHLIRLLVKDDIGEPFPYLAVLVADGDRMGEALSSIRSAPEHRNFSANLSRFAGEARNIVKGHNGFAVYSGGDDLLAFLPEDKCLEAARELHERFSDISGGLTLSIGIAIGHKNVPLEDLLKHGRNALSAAKDPNRNGLAIHLHTRSGGDPMKVREQWKPRGNNGMDKRLNQWVQMHLDDTLPDKAAYDLYQLAKDYEVWTHPPPADLLGKDMRRLLQRKRAAHGKREITAADIKSLMEGVVSVKDILKRAKELLIARHIATAAAGGGEP